MPLDIDPEELRRAVGHRVRVTAFGIPYVGTLIRYDEELARLEIQEGDNVAIVERERIDQFAIDEEESS